MKKNKQNEIICLLLNMLTSENIVQKYLLSDVYVSIYVGMNKKH